MFKSNDNKGYNQLKFLLKLLLNDSKRESGFILPVAFGIAAIAVGLVGMAIVNANNDKTRVTSEEAQKEAMALAQSAVSFYIGYLKDNPKVSTLCTNNSSPDCKDKDGNNVTGGTWGDVTAANLNSGGGGTSNVTYCSGAGGGGGGTTTYTNSDADDINAIATDVQKKAKGEFELISYAYDASQNPGIGTMVVEARIGQGTGTDGEGTTGTAVMEVKVPITTNVGAGSSSGSIAGVWVTNTSDAVKTSGTQSFQAVVRKECKKPKNGNIKSPAMVGGNNPDPIYNGTIPDIDESEMKVPSLPAIPSSAYNIPSLDMSNCYVTFPRLGDDKATSCSGLSGTFNNKTDTPDAQGRFHYKINGSSQEALKLSNAAILINPKLDPDSPSYDSNYANHKVILYLSGSKGTILSSGTSTKVRYKNNEIVVNNVSGSSNKTSTKKCTYGNTSQKGGSFINQLEPSFLEVYGYGNTDISISDNNMVSGLFHFPNAQFKLSQAEVRGAVWAKKVDFSNSDGTGGSSGCAVAVIQRDLGEAQIPLMVQDQITEGGEMQVNFGLTSSLKRVKK